MNPTVRKLQKPAFVVGSVLWLGASIDALLKAIQGGGIGWWLWCGATAFLAWITIVGVLRMKKPD